MTKNFKHGFELFHDEELFAGYRYALEKDGVSLSLTRLREIMNDAGKTRINAEKLVGKMTPREAIKRSLKAFERRYPGAKISEKEYQALVHAGAKMFSERSPNTKAKRHRDHEAQEALAVLHGIDTTPPIDPKVNREIGLGLKGDLFEDPKTGAQ